MQNENPASFDAHDLVWLKAGVLERQRDWARNLPDWAVSELARGNPLTVRRAPPASGAIPVGHRGHQRNQRHATYIASTEVERTRKPSDLRACAAREERIFLPCLNAWDALRIRARDFSHPWGPAGSCAYELATGADWVTPASDLDIVIYIERPITPRQANRILALFSSESCRTDVQLITPQGGMALLEWARGSTQVLLKTRHGPILTDKPWGILQEYA